MSERRSGYTTSAAGLVGALIAALAVIVFVWGLTRFQHRDVADPVEEVDYTAQLAEARRVAPFDVLAPAELPTGWRATSADFSRSGPEYSWHLGILTGPSDSAEYVGLEQSNAQSSTFIAESTRADEPAEPVMIDGIEWDRLTNDDETALILVRDDETTVVTGTASLDELTEFAETLSPT